MPMMSMPMSTVLASIAAAVVATMLFIVMDNVGPRPDTRLVLIRLR
jgi:hypothetical protein